MSEEEKEREEEEEGEKEGEEEEDNLLVSPAVMSYIKDLGDLGFLLSSSLHPF